MCEGFSEDAERRFVDYLETFDESGLDPLPLRLAIHDAELVADFTGVAPQVPVPVNSTLAVIALLPVGLRNPVADRLRCRLELAGKLGRITSSSNQIDHLAAKLR